MSIQTSPENRSVNYRSSRSHWRSVAILFALLVSITVLAGIGVRRQYAASEPLLKIDASHSPRYWQKMMSVESLESSFAGAAVQLNLSQSASTQEPTTMTPGAAMSAAPPPGNIAVIEEQVQPPNSPGRPVFIGFDGLPYSPQVDPAYDTIPLAFAIPANQFPDAIFSTTPGYHVATYGRPYGTALPSLTRATDFYNYANHLVPLIVDFPRGVSDLSFDVIGSDVFGPIGSMEIYQNRVLTRTDFIYGSGNAYFPARQNAALSSTNVTRIVITRITDPAGIGFDNFNFTVPPPPSPTPTPTPSPGATPPPAPTNVKATPDEAQISVSWAPSQSASSYTIKRSQTAGSSPTNASPSEILAFVPVAPPFFCNGISVPCVFTDTALDHTVTYSYVISATNNSGSSPDSSPPASAKPLPKNACELPTKQRPTSRNVSRYGWNMEVNVTDDEGLKLRFVSLNGRLMAESMSVPYFRLGAQTLNGSSSNQRGQLKPAGDDPSLRSRLVDYKVIETDPEKLVVRAAYEIDRISGTPNACLNISQQYEFYREGFHGRCEPSGTVTCARFRPLVTYNFHGQNGEFLSSLNIPQRHHYQVNGAPANTVGVFLDPDTRVEGALAGFDFPAKMNPVTTEFWSTVIGRTSGNFAAGTRPSFRFDNIHQTNQALVKEPPISPGIHPELHLVGAGCPECVHNHWRWGAFFGPQWGNGRPGIPAGSTQTVDVGVVRYPGMVGPGQDWLSLINGESLYTTVPLDPVVWYSPTGYMSSDSFFTHTAWFNPHPPAGGAANITPAAGSQTQTTTEDGPVSVAFGDVYQTGSTNVAPFDLSTVAPLPAGYAPLNNAGYMITTTAIVSGPHTFTFSAASVSDQQTFNNLRIFHPEPDPFDPEAYVWVNRTILPPDTPVPDFSSRLLYARSEGLGLYVIGRLV